MKKFTTPVRCHQLTLFYKSLCAFGLFLVCCVNLQAQHIDSLLSIAETNFPQEKVYIQTDKSIYAGGETIWFKAYLTADNQPGPFCKTLYAELITDKGYVLQRRTMPIVLSGASSDFIVPDSLNDSKLFIRAYTQWMLNFDSTLLCVKPVYVIPRKAPGKKNVAAVTTLTFFPEGGDLIEEIESTVAFKAVNQDGIPVAVSGDILNSQNKKIAAFSAVHDGMGTFLLQPMAGEKYKAVWKDKSGKPHETALPPAKKTGVAIHISYVANKLYYTLQRPQAADESYTKFTVMAQSQQRMMYAAAINMSQKTTVTAPIETDSIPDGVVQITVFNALSQPVAERLVFVNNNNYSFITDLHMAEQNMNKRARSVLQIDVGGKTLSNLSVSVTDADVNPAGKNEENIYSGLLLSSDLKGYVYNPAYYFSEADSAKSHLDLVMLTNGWRRLKWENIIAGQWPVIKYQPQLPRYRRKSTGLIQNNVVQPLYYSPSLLLKAESHSIIQYR